MLASHADLLATAHELADAAAAAVRPHFRSNLSIENKHGEGGFDPVTAADRAAEIAIREKLAERFPDHAILGEEFAGSPNAASQTSAYRWVIDPIDGTRAFILGLPTWGTLIGVEENGKPVVGLMDQPILGDRFWSDGKMSRLRQADGSERTLQARRAPLAAAQLSTTSPELFAPGFEQAAFAAVRQRVRACRFGGDCYAYALLAAGLIDVVMEAGLQPYDIIALVPIIEAAGGVVTTWDGGPASAGGRIIACGDPEVHSALLSVIAECARMSA